MKLVNLEVLRPRFQRYITEVPIAGCWLWTAALCRYGNAHGVIGAGLGRKGGLIKAHRLSWLLHKGEIPEGLSVLHKCDVSSCCNPDHLYLGTQQDNLRDSRERGQLGPGRNCGENNGSNCRLTKEQVLYLRRTDLPRGELSRCAEEWNITHNYISVIRARTKWKHI